MGLTADKTNDFEIWLIADQLRTSIDWAQKAHDDKDLMTSPLFAMMCGEELMSARQAILRIGDGEVQERATVLHRSVKTLCTGMFMCIMAKIARLQVASETLDKVLEMPPA